MSFTTDWTIGEATNRFALEEIAILHATIKGTNKRLYASATDL